MKTKFVSLLMVLVFMPVLAVAVLTASGSFEVKDLSVYGIVPSFELIERDGRSFSKSELQGKVWVASFVFTHCSGQCPILCEKLKRVQSRFRFKDNFRLVSITMDPQRDSPSVLSEYAKRFDADPYKWWFLTGPKEDIDFLTQSGFRLASGGPGGEEPEGITHSFKLVLVDGMGRIRGYYDGLDDTAVDTLIRDTKGLLRKTF